MEFCGWRKTIAVTVLIAFIGIGIAWAMEQDSPQFQEKEGAPMIKAHKKFPWLIVLLGTAAVGAGIYFLTKKKKNVNPEPTPLTYTVKIYNIMRADVQRTITFDSLPNANKSFSSTDLSIAGVYDKYIVMRSEGSANELGNRLAFGKNSSVSFNTPSSNTTLCAYFFENMDDGRNDLYDKMFENENTSSGVELPAGRNSSWYRFDADGRTGPQSVWNNTCARLDNALKYAFKVGSITATGGSQHKYGFRYCGGADGSKDMSAFWIGVDSDKIGLEYVTALERTALEEWFEYSTYSNNIDNKPSRDTICDPLSPEMNRTGVRLIRAVYVASDKN